MAEVRKLRLHRKGVQMVLSPLEEDVLSVLWRKEEARVRDVHAHLSRKKRVALTSVAVTLDRLHKKKAVQRRVETGRGGPHYLYTPLNGRAEFERSIIDSAVNRLISSFGSSAVTYFNERFGRRGRDV